MKLGPGAQFAVSFLILKGFTDLGFSLELDYYQKANNRPSRSSVPDKAIGKYKKSTTAPPIRPAAMKKKKTYDGATKSRFPLYPNLTLLHNIANDSHRILKIIFMFFDLFQIIYLYSFFFLLPLAYYTRSVWHFILIWNLVLVVVMISEIRDNVIIVSSAQKCGKMP